jgi:flagellar biosynthesis protein FliP
MNSKAPNPLSKSSLFSLFALFIFIFFFPSFISAENGDLINSLPTPEGDDTMGGAPNVLTKIGVIALFSLLPYAVMLLTSFLKMVVVLSLLRNALGVQQSPPNPAINGIALIMAIYV